MSDHAVVVLAAGGSQRLGMPKQLLRVQGETLLRRAVRLAAQTDPQTLLVVLAQAADFAGEVTGLPAQIVYNPAPQRGLGSSLALASAHVRACRHVLVLVCDQPALTADHLRALLAGAAGAASGCAATVLQDTRGVPAVVPGAWFALPDELQDTDRGFGARLRAVPAHHIALCVDAALAHDIDTLDDLQRARRAGWLDAAPAQGCR